jgi:hypothetical protein
MCCGEGTPNPVDMAYTRNGEALTNTFEIIKLVSNYVQFALRNLSIKIPIKRKKSLLLGAGKVL